MKLKLVPRFRWMLEHFKQRNMPLFVDAQELDLSPLLKFKGGQGEKIVPHSKHIWFSGIFCRSWKISSVDTIFLFINSLKFLQLWSFEIIFRKKFKKKKSEIKWAIKMKKKICILNTFHFPKWKSNIS